MKNGRLYEGDTLDEIWPRRRKTLTPYGLAETPETASGERAWTPGDQPMTPQLLPDGFTQTAAGLMGHPSGRRVFGASRRAFIGSVVSAVAGLVLGSLRRAGAKRLVADLQDAILQVMQSAHIPGLSLAIVRDGELAHVAGYGWADIEQRRAMQPETLINLGSVTKTLTCAAVMQCWERQRVSLDADLNDYLSLKVRNPAFPTVPITVRQLLTHTASIKDGPAYEESYACGDSRQELGQWLRAQLSASGEASVVRLNFHPWKPGARWAYSNIAFGLLGYVVERLANQSYADYIAEHIFSPLGMIHSRILLNGMDRSAHATPYTYVADGRADSVTLRDPRWTPPTHVTGGLQVPHCLYSFATPPDGSARSSARELARFLMAFMNGGALDGQRILQSRTVALILSDQRVRFEPGSEAHTTRQGLAWDGLANLVPDRVLWGHTGGDPGIRTLMVFDPHERTGVVVLSNSDSDDGVTAVARRLWGAV